MAYTVTSLGDYSFSRCGQLRSVSIPASVTLIGKYAFRECYNLISVPIPASVTSIGEYAFSYCAIDSVTIPASVSSIGRDAFDSSKTLSKVEFASVEAMCKIAYESKGSNPLYRANELWIAGKEVKDLIVPNSVISIRNYAFCGARCLTSLSIPNSVTSIGEYAFAYCSRITTLRLPAALDKIGGYAFYKLDKLAEVYYPCEYPAIGTDDVFEGKPPYATLHVPEQSLKRCEVTPPWSSFKIIEAYDFSKEILIDKIEFNPNTFEGIPGDTFTITTIVTPSDANDQSLAWSSSDPTVASVDNSGNVKILS